MATEPKHPCPTCHGEGVIESTTHIHDRRYPCCVWQVQRIVCPTCHGAKSEEAR